MKILCEFKLYVTILSEFEDRSYFDFKSRIVNSEHNDLKFIKIQSLNHPTN